MVTGSQDKTAKVCTTAVLFSASSFDDLLLPLLVVVCIGRVFAGSVPGTQERRVEC